MILKKAVEQARFHPDKMGKADLVTGNHLFAGLNAFEPGQVHEPHSHCDRDKLYLVLRGTGEISIGDDTTSVEPGDVAMAPAGVVHSVTNSGSERLVLMAVLGPPPPTDGKCK